MVWVFVDIAVAGIALIALALVLVSTWRSVKRLGRQVTSSSDTLAALTAALPDRPPRS